MNMPWNNRVNGNTTGSEEAKGMAIGISIRIAIGIRILFRRFGCIIVIGTEIATGMPKG